MGDSEFLDTQIGLFNPCVTWNHRLIVAGDTFNVRITKSVKQLNIPFSKRNLVLLYDYESMRADFLPVFHTE